MDNEHIAKRAQDVQAGLRDVRDTLVSATIPKPEWPAEWPVQSSCP